MKTLLEQLKDLQAVQKENLADDYMVGLYNGLELAIATTEKRDPIYEKHGPTKYAPRRNLYDVIHSDEVALVRFALQMRDKLALSRTRGRHGWEQAEAEHLSNLLREHVNKGDPVDVANLAMMLGIRNLRITPE